MADLENREQYEDEMIAILLLIFATDTPFFWESNPASPRMMYDRISQSGIGDIVGEVSTVSSKNLLDEIDFRHNRTYQDLAEMSEWNAEKYMWDLAKRMAQAHKRWQRKQEVAKRSGEEAPGFEDLYTDSDAKREAITGLSNLISDTEDEGIEFLVDMHGIRVVRYWERDRRSNTCEACWELAGLKEEDWREIFDDTPPRHPNCRCWMQNFLYVDS